MNQPATGRKVCGESLTNRAWRLYGEVDVRECVRRLYRETRSVEDISLGLGVSVQTAHQLIAEALGTDPIGPETFRDGDL